MLSGFGGQLTIAIALAALEIGYIVLAVAIVLQS
jgi:hypothetical protein